MLAGLSAVICGVIFGFIFSKVILLVCSKILALTETLPFYLPWKPILLTIGIFGLLFLIVSFVTSFTIRVNNLKALLLSQKEPKKRNKSGLVYRASRFGTNFRRIWRCTFFSQIGNTLLSLQSLLVSF